MRQSYPHKSLWELCTLFGISRQAYYQATIHQYQVSMAESVVLQLVTQCRLELRGKAGVRKMWTPLKSKLAEHGITMGRDRLFDLLRSYHLLLRRRTRKVKTTDSHHWLKKYPNLIKGLVVIAPGQLWVSDITYISTLEGFCYLSLITDAYSRKIMGYCLYPTLEAIGCIKALEMALTGKPNPTVYPLIHHSDGGIQYCSYRYIEILKENHMEISMAKSPYENAIAERINGTVKNEFEVVPMYKSYRAAKLDIPKIVTIYNQKRPHSSIDYLTPEQAHLKEGPIKRRWKSYHSSTKKKEV